MSKDPSGVPIAEPVTSGPGIVRLHERVSGDLRKNFREVLIEERVGEFTPDLVIRHGGHVTVVEVKTGDPTMPLPSSANVQMLILKDGVRKWLGEEVVPVLVTNYRIDEADQKEMADSGIKIIAIQGLNYDSKSLSKKVSEIVEVNPSLSSNSILESE